MTNYLERLLPANAYDYGHKMLVLHKNANYAQDRSEHFLRAPPATRDANLVLLLIRWQ